MMVLEKGSCNGHEVVQTGFIFAKNRDIIGKKYCCNVDVCQRQPKVGLVELQTKVVDKDGEKQW